MPCIVEQSEAARRETELGRLRDGAIPIRRPNNRVGGDVDYDEVERFRLGPGVRYSGLERIVLRGQEGPRVVYVLVMRNGEVWSDRGYGNRAGKCGEWEEEEAEEDEGGGDGEAQGGGGGHAGAAEGGFWWVSGEWAFLGI